MCVRGGACAGVCCGAATLQFLLLNVLPAMAENISIDEKGERSAMPKGIALNLLFAENID